MWNRKAALALSPPIEQWPIVDREAIDVCDREQFDILHEAMTLYLENHSLADIVRITGVPRMTLTSVAKRCLAMAEDGRIQGLRALIPYIHIKPYKRKKGTSPKRPEQHGGQAGALGALLAKISDLEQLLVKHIKQEAKRCKVAPHRLRPSHLHRIFISVIKELGLPETEWPFNTKYRGIRTIQKFMKAVLHNHFARAVAITGEKDAKAHLSVGTGHEPFLIYRDPYDAIEIDAYNIDSLFSVAVKTPEGAETELLLERLWLIAAVERLSKAILAYTIVYRSEVTADDVLKVIKDAATGKWTPMQLTIPGLRYPARGGLPSGVIEQAHGAVWSVTLLDGALAHLAHSVRERARTAIGFVINWGPVGHFERRPNVERAFGQIAKDLFQRLPSTTGCNPFNGRAPDAEGKAVRYKIRASEIEELLDVLVAQKNALHTEGLSMPPLVFLRYYLEGAEPLCYPRKLPKTVHDTVKILASREIVTVRGGVKTGRRPYVQIDRVHYTSPLLADSPHLIGKKLIAHIDEEDLRQVKVFLEDGAELGFLMAQGRWSRTKHSRRTRRLINSLLHRRLIMLTEFDDPVEVYRKYLSTPSKPKEPGKQELSRRQVTDATRLAIEMGSQTTLQIEEPQKHRPVTTPTVKEVQQRPTLLKSPSVIIGRVRNRS